MHSYEYPRVMNTVDVVLFTVTEDARRQAPPPRRGPPAAPPKSLKVVLTPRRSEPNLHELSVPGAFVRPASDDTLMDTANRVLYDKCGLTGIFMEQLKTYGDAKRDLRGWCVTTVYYALVPPNVLARSTADLHLVDARTVKELPFDHNRLVAEGVARLAGKATYTTLPIKLLPKRFTMSQLEEAYEALLGRPLTTAYFRRKMDELKVSTDSGEKPFLIKTDETAPSPFGGRNAVLYEAATEETIAFPQRF